MMRRLHRKVNIVVVIAKADSLTAAEVKRLKMRILSDLSEHQIQVNRQHKAPLAFVNIVYIINVLSANYFAGIPIPRMRQR